MRQPRPRPAPRAAPALCHVLTKRQLARGPRAAAPRLAASPSSLLEVVMGGGALVADARERWRSNGCSGTRSGRILLEVAACERATPALGGSPTSWSAAGEDRRHPTCYSWWAEDAQHLLDRRSAYKVISFLLCLTCLLDVNGLLEGMRAWCRLLECMHDESCTIDWKLKLGSSKFRVIDGSFWLSRCISYRKYRRWQSYSLVTDPWEIHFDSSLGWQASWRSVLVN